MEGDANPYARGGQNPSEKALPGPDGSAPESCRQHQMSPRCSCHGFKVWEDARVDPEAAPNYSMQRWLSEKPGDEPWNPVSAKG